MCLPLVLFTIQSTVEGAKKGKGWAWIKLHERKEVAFETAENFVARVRGGCHIE